MLEVRSLSVEFKTGVLVHRVVSDLSFTIAPGEIAGLVGESGSGKTMTALAILSLLKIRFPRAMVSGGIFYKGTNLVTAPEAVLRGLRGARISMIFQNPFTYFNPSIKIRDQFREALFGLPFSRVYELLEAVHLADNGRILQSYPHTLSGGQLQRLMIAMALLHHPELLIADEPTTALDASLKMEILNLLLELQQNFGLSMLIISHDLGAVSRICDRLVVLYRGILAEESAPDRLLAEPLHPYTQELLLKREPKKDSSAGDSLPSGCPYHPRCPSATAECASSVPPLFDAQGGRRVRCWLYKNRE